MSQLGRPTKYKPEYAIQAKKLSNFGATDREIAEFFEVAESTIYLWKLEHEDFSESLKLGKGVADERVKRALYHRALGYSHAEDDIRVVNQEIVVTPTVKHYPPDSTALIFWLKNRLPDEFRNNPSPDEEDVPTPVTITVQVQDSRKPVDDSTEA